MPTQNTTPKSTRTRPAAVTHFVFYDEPRGYLVRAACGRLVDILTHANEPTCSACVAALADHASLAF